MPLQSFSEEKETESHPELPYDSPYATANVFDKLRVLDTLRCPLTTRNTCEDVNASTSQENTILGASQRLSTALTADARHVCGSLLSLLSAAVTNVSELANIPGCMAAGRDPNSAAHDPRPRMKFVSTAPFCRQHLFKALVL